MREGVQENKIRSPGVITVPLKLCLTVVCSIERRIKREQQAAKQTPEVPEKPSKSRQRFNTESDMKEMMGKEDFVKEVLQRSMTNFDGFKDQISM